MGFAHNHKDIPECKLLLSIVDIGFTELVRYWKIKKSGKPVPVTLRNEIEFDYSQAMQNCFWTESISRNYRRIYQKLGTMTYQEIYDIKFDFYKSGKTWKIKEKKTL